VSKVNELRRRATEAVRGRKYDRAIELYGKICDLEPSNGTPRNELGDLYLKTGSTLEALDSFSLSARLFSEFGLTNNAVAVFKKMLRHDPNHLDSLWGLAEIRREQGLDADASAGYLEYLSRADQVPDAGRAGFYDQAEKLIGSMADDMEILSRLEEIYRAAERGEDVAKVLIAKARQAHIAGEHEVRDLYIEHAIESCDICESLPAYHDYLDEIAPVDYSAEEKEPGTAETARSGVADADAVEGSAMPEPGVIELDGAGVDEFWTDPPVTDDDPAVEDPAATDDGYGAGPKTVVLNTDALDLGFDFEADALDEAVANHAAPTTIIGAVGEDDPVSPDPDTWDAPEAEDDEPASGTLNLLDEILADGSFDVVEDQRQQVEMIAREMEGQIAGDVDTSDHGGQYELGIVYMDMGLFERATEALDLASRGENYRLGSLEMRGTCLLRLGRDTEAMESFREGLKIEGQPDNAYLGLLYGVACCLELHGELEEARDHFRRVVQVDAGFLDASNRLEKIGEPL